MFHMGVLTNLHINQQILRHEGVLTNLHINQQGIRHESVFSYLAGYLGC